MVIILTSEEYNLLKNLIDKEIELEELSKVINKDIYTLNAWIEILKSKKFVEKKEEIYYKISLTEEGKKYAIEGLPEYKLYLLLKDLKKVSLKELKKYFEENLLNIALTNSIKRGFIKIENNNVILIKNYIEDIDNILKSLINNDLILKEINELIKELKSRKLINVQTLKRTYIKLDPQINYILKNNLYKIEEEISKLNSQDIITGKWKMYKIKRYNLKALPPINYFGRTHVYMKFLDEIKKILLEMGFEEYDESYIVSEFWNFDVLFVPQDHPARDLQSTFKLKLDPANIEEELMIKVKKVHEEGMGDSIGWRYKWDAEIARKLILRTHTTVVSAKYLYNYKDKEAKVFCISRNFRYDIPDPTHFIEFYQCEGIMVGKKLNFSNLLGFLKEFASRLGLEKIKFKPTYFPFTEPSVEGSVYHRNLGWIEALPGGMFRPEMLIPLGITYNVLAWGIGIDRIAMTVLEITDIRELFSKNLNFLREAKLV